MKAAEDANAPVGAGAGRLPKANEGKIVVQEIPDVKFRPRHVEELAAADALLHVAVGDADPLRAVDRVARYARALLLSRGVR